MEKGTIIKMLVLLTISFTACKILDDGTEKDFINGIVKHKYTNSPISGIEIQLDEIEYRPYTWDSDTIFNDKTKTNSSGKFSLKIKSTNNFSIYRIRTQNPELADTTKIASKFIPKEIYLTSDDLNKIETLIIELEPIMIGEQ